MVGGGATQAQWQLFECEKCHGISLLNMIEADLSPIKVDAHQKKPSLPPAPPRMEIPRTVLPKPPTEPVAPLPVPAPEPMAQVVDEFQKFSLSELEQLPDPLPAQPKQSHWIWKGLPFAVLAAAFYALIGVAQLVTRSVPPQSSKARPVQHLNEKVALQNETAVRDALQGKTQGPVQEQVEESRSAPASHVRIVSEAVTLRAGPSAEYSYLGSMRKGMTSEILESRPEEGSLQLWYKVSEPASQLTGWVRGDVVELMR